MLVLSRKPSEKILIGDDITITIVRIGPNTVRVGIDAPPHLSIVREELVQYEDEEIEQMELAEKKLESKGAD